MSDGKPSEPIDTLDAASLASLRTSSSSSLMPGTTASLPELVAGRYRILGLLGAGGMGSVYRARDEHLDETVALKVLRRDLVDQPEMLERFRREVKLARRVTHKNVARTFDLGEHGDEKFITMELIDGVALADVIAQQAPLAVARVVELGARICDGLTAAHEAGVVHRDLKPDNVMIARDGRVVIADFGIARDAEATQKTMAGVVGTPAYMAPEQVEGTAGIDERADIYALGVMLFEMVTAKLPWRGRSSIMIAVARLEAQPPDPRSVRAELPAPLAELILRCMARLPADRFAHARDVAAALAELSTLAEPRRPTGSVSVTRTPSPHPVAPVAKTLAVLPFRNAGPPEDAYLADGLTDDLIDTLSMTAGLRVRPRSVVMRLKAAERDVLDLGRELDVQVVVDGTVRRTPAGLRISARLVSVADGFQLWARRYDRPASDALIVADEAAQAIAEALTVVAAPRRAHAIDPAALDLYLRARQHYYSYVSDSIATSVELFRKALEIEPDHPTILIGNALAQVRLWSFRGPTFDSGPARDAVERAVAAGPQLGEARMARGYLLFHSGDVPGAVREYQRALALSPSLVDALEQLGRIELEVDRLDSGIRRLEAAVALDAGATSSRWNLGRAYALTGQWDRSDALIGETRNATTDVVRWAHCMRMASWRRDLLGIADLAASRPADVLEVNAYAQGITRTLASGSIPNDFDTGLGLLQRSTATGAQPFFYQLRAEMAGLLGLPEVGIESLKTAVDVGLIDLAWIERCPLLDGLRGDERFAAQRDRLRTRARPIQAALDEGSAKD